MDPATGLPVYQPNAYMLMHRQRLVFSSYRKELETLIMVHAWAEDVGVDLGTALEGLKGLSSLQVASLCDVLREARTKGKTVVEPSTWHRRVGWAKNYLLQRMEDAEYLRDPEDSLVRQRRREDLAKHFITEGPPPEAAKTGKRAGMPLKLIPRLTEVTRPEHPLNPWSRRDRLRNWILLRFWLMGFRLAEPLTLRCRSGRLDDPDNDLNLGRYPTVALRVRPEDPDDPRQNAPTLKTAGRLLPLDAELARDIIRYQDIRRQLPKARRHWYLIVGSAGQPLSLSSADRLWRRLQLKHPEFIPYSIHSLRHAADDMMTEALSKNPKLNPEMRNDIITYWFGWSPSSKMPKHYANGFLLEQTQRALEHSILRFYFKSNE